MSAEQARASADVLLAHAKKQDRGRLKIFLGAAPGVGKTYAMLTAARAAKAEGKDVLAGVVETHGRAETEALLLGFDVLPRKPIVYVNRILNEFDIDAALQRRPDSSSSTNTRTPTSPAAAIPSAGRTSRNCWLRASTYGRR